MSTQDNAGDPPCWAYLEEDGLRQQLSRDSTLASLVHQLADAVIVANRDGVIVYWNAAAERLFGWSAGEAEGRTLDLIIPEKQQRAHWDGYHNVMRTGESRYGTKLLRVPSQHRNGTLLSIAFTVTLLTNLGGEISGIAAVLRDETNRWADEQDLRRRLRQFESAAQASQTI